MKPLRWLFHWLVALVVLFEEWGWEPLSRLMAQLAQLPVIGWLERRIARLAPVPALLVFLVPALLLLPVKLAALALISHGHVAVGVSVILMAKLVGTAIVARLFQLTRPALMQLEWFAHWYGRWTVWKEALLVRVRASRAWRVGRVLRRQVTQQVRRLTAGFSRP